MKLRNKKTGEYGRFMMCHDDDRYPFYIEATGESRLYYHNFEEILRAGWEVYVAPTDPLIRDEKIRKAVRLCAYIWGADKILVIKSGSRIEFSDGSPSMRYVSFMRAEWQDEIEDRTYYTIDELCGTPEPLEPAFVDLDERINEKEEE